MAAPARQRAWQNNSPEGAPALRYTFHQAIALLQNGSVDVKPLLAERLPIERFPEALRLAGSGDALKVQIQP